MQPLQRCILFSHMLPSAVVSGASLHPGVTENRGSCFIQIQSRSAKKMQINLTAKPDGHNSTSLEKPESDQPLKSLNASFSHQNHSSDSLTVPRAKAKSWNSSLWINFLSLETARAVANRGLAEVATLMGSVPLSERYPTIGGITRAPYREPSRSNESTQSSHGGALFMLGFVLILILSTIFACSVAVYVSAPVGEEPQITKDVFCCYIEDQNQIVADDPVSIPELRPVAINVSAPVAEVSPVAIDVPSFVPPPSSVTPHITLGPDTGQDQILQLQYQSYDPWHDIAAQPVLSADPMVPIHWGTSIGTAMTASPLT